jgi:hypothetical protein
VLWWMAGKRSLRRWVWRLVRWSRWRNRSIALRCALSVARRRRRVERCCAVRHAAILKPVLGVLCQMPGRILAIKARQSPPPSRHVQKPIAVSHGVNKQPFPSYRDARHPHLAGVGLAQTLNATKSSPGHALRFCSPQATIRRCEWKRPTSTASGSMVLKIVPDEQGC